MKKILFLLAILLIPVVYAETTFFDNPDDMFIYSNPASQVSGRGGGGGGGRGCLYKWNCTNWSECLPSGKQIRNCINVGTCSNTYNAPEIEQNCTYTALKMEKDEKLEKNSVIEKDMKKEPENEETAHMYKIFIKKRAPGSVISFISVMAVIILLSIFYLNKDYFKKLIKKSR
ncbi:hypothetical protein JW851_02710 [Candidatus Woesearchaeota archaeon]|nr:hypothetical protein [Candidatus Woesearchaeota archaeon]